MEPPGLHPPGTTASALAPPLTPRLFPVPGDAAGAGEQRQPRPLPPLPLLLLLLPDFKAQPPAPGSQRGGAAAVAPPSPRRPLL